MAKRINPLIRVDYGLYRELKLINQCNGNQITKLTRQLIPYAKSLRIKSEKETLRKIEPKLKQIFYLMGIFALNVLFYANIWEMIK
jgi:hypothetical protein